MTQLDQYFGFLATRAKNGAILLGHSEITEWPSNIIPSLQKTGVLVPAQNASHIKCPGCHENCYIEPDVYVLTNGNCHVQTLCREQGCRVDIDAVLLNQYEIIPDKLKELGYWDINPPKVPGESDKSEMEPLTKKRPTKKEMADRNRSVAYIVGEFQANYGRIPTVCETMGKTGYTRQQIYQTDAYKEGKISGKSAKLTDEIAGASITNSEYFAENSIAHTRANNRSKSEQAEIDALIDEQAEDANSRFVK